LKFSSKRGNKNDLDWKTIQMEKETSLEKECD
jgi:hypothetical protein